jgi:hypothetical protein
MDETGAPLVPEVPADATPDVIADGEGGHRLPESADAPVVPNLR